MFFKYDRKLNTILFRAAWGALSQTLGMNDRELAAIFTVQTAGEALNYHPHLHGLLADGYWKDGVFTRFLEVDLAAIEKAFAERVLAPLHKRELITDDDVAQILSQDHTGFGVWMGEPFHDKESEQFVARYIERAPLSLEKLSIQDDIVTYTTKDGAAHACLAVALCGGGSLTLWSFSLNFHVTSRKPTNQSQDTTVATPVGDGVNALSSPLLHLKNKRATIGGSSVGVDGPRA